MLKCLACYTEIFCQVDSSLSVTVLYAKSFIFTNSISTQSIVYVLFIGGLNVASHYSSYQIFYFQCDLAGMLITVG